MSLSLLALPGAFVFGLGVRYASRDDGLIALLLRAVGGFWALWTVP